MWICRRCQNENRETFSLCEHCGAPRSAGRFASAPRRAEDEWENQTNRQPHLSPNVTPPVQNPDPIRSPRVTEAAARQEAARAVRMPADDIPPPIPQPAPPAPPAPTPRRPLIGFARLVGMLLLIMLPIFFGVLLFLGYEAICSFIAQLNIGMLVDEWIIWAVFGFLSLMVLLLSMLPGLRLLVALPPKRKWYDEE